MGHFNKRPPLVKPNRRTSHPADPFGVGILEADWEELALQAEWEDRFNASIPLGIFGRCCLCGERCDYLEPDTGLCDRCCDLACNDSTACINQLHGLGRRVF